MNRWRDWVGARKGRGEEEQKSGKKGREEGVGRVGLSMLWWKMGEGEAKYDTHTKIKVPWE